MKNASTTIAILALFTGAINGTQRCFSSRYSDKRYCVDCYLSQPLGTSFGCGPKLSTTDPCAFYHRDLVLEKNTCVQCKIGYALKSTTSQDNPICIGGQVQGCTNERTILGETGGSCLSCGDGKYSKLLNSGSHYYYQCVSVPNQIENCMWGGRIINNRPYCARCAAGFTLGPNKDSCLKVSPPGCFAQAFGGACDLCDVYNGYSKQPEGGACQKAN